MKRVFKAIAATTNEDESNKKYRLPETQNKTLYFGEMLLGTIPNGNGIMFNENSDNFLVGTWVEGIRDGTYCTVTPNKLQIAIGEFIHGKLTGIIGFCTSKKFPTLWEKANELRSKVTQECDFKDLIEEVINMTFTGFMDIRNIYLSFYLDCSRSLHKADLTAAILHSEVTECLKNTFYPLFPTLKDIIEVKVIKDGKSNGLGIHVIRTVEYTKVLLRENECGQPNGVCVDLQFCNQPRSKDLPLEFHSEGRNLVNERLKLSLERFVRCHVLSLTIGRVKDGKSRKQLSLVSCERKRQGVDKICVEVSLRSNGRQSNFSSCEEMRGKW